MHNSLIYQPQSGVTSSLTAKGENHPGSQGLGVFNMF